MIHKTGKSFLRKNNINFLLVFQHTALHYACANNFPKAVRMLLARNADVTARTVRKETPLDLATLNLSNEACIALLQSDK
jgi:ankyrin repeat protein